MCLHWVCGEGRGHQCDTLPLKVRALPQKPGGGVVELISQGPAQSSVTVRKPTPVTMRLDPRGDGDCLGVLWGCLP